MSQPSVTLPYRTPQERARIAVRRQAENSAISLGIIVCLALAGFVSAGDFSEAAWVALGTATATKALDLAVTFLRHLQAARADDAALSQ